MADSDKSEKPSARRLLKAREQGNFLSSQQFISGAQSLAFVSLLNFFGYQWFLSVNLIMRDLLRRAFSPSEFSLYDWVILFRQLAWYGGGPILFAVAILALLTLALQLGM